ncbi:MAG: hypothetical protein NTY99_00750, partial [DPANN group archaeon]|nr:hypothetical protein [DPANN group archaeon]
MAIADMPKSSEESVHAADNVEFADFLPSPSKNYAALWADNKMIIFGKDEPYWRGPSKVMCFEPYVYACYNRVQTGKLEIFTDSNLEVVLHGEQVYLFGIRKNTKIINEHDRSISKTCRLNCSDLPSYAEKKDESFTPFMHTNIDKVFSKDGLLYLIVERWHDHIQSGAKGPITPEIFKYDPRKVVPEEKKKARHTKIQDLTSLFEPVKRDTFGKDHIVRVLGADSQR